MKDLVRTPTRFAVVDCSGKPRLLTPEVFEVLLELGPDVSELTDLQLDRLFTPYAAMHLDDGNG